MVIRRVGELGVDGIGRAGRQRDDENLIICLKTRSAEYALDAGRLTVRCAWKGREETAFEGRRIFIDDDAWLAVCPGSTVYCRIAADREIDSLTILYRPGFAESVLESLLTPPDRLLMRGPGENASLLPFAPQLQPHDRTVTPVLLFIKRHCEMGIADDLWYEEQLAFLVERLLLRHRQVVATAQAIPARRAATRREIMRRIALATDYIHSAYDRPISLDDLAGAACLSRHHFLRLFKAVHGITPQELLQRKRTLAAARLLQDERFSVEDVVRRVGFDSRSTLFRALRRFHGVTPRECRRSHAVASNALAAYAAA